MGANEDDVGPRFPSLSAAYDPELRAGLHAVADELGTPLHDGVYLAVTGPSFETPAEIRAFRTLGADLVGMSTVPEAIAAHALGAEVLGISLVTNLAAGITGDRLSHEEVVSRGEAAAPRLASLLVGIVSRF
jgi:purine-nucleoside phosphorylase